MEGMGWSERWRQRRPARVAFVRVAGASVNDRAANRPDELATASVGVTMGLRVFVDGV